MAILPTVRKTAASLAPHLPPLARQALVSAKLIPAAPDLARVPRTAQQTLPFLGITPDGTVMVNRYDFATCLQVSDVNLSLAPEAEQEEIWGGFAAFHNTIDRPVQWLVVNDTLDPKAVLQVIPDDLLPEYLETPCVDDYRAWLTQQVEGRQAADRRRYLILNARPNRPEEAGAELARKVAQAESIFKKFKVRCDRLEAEGYLELLWRLLHPEECRQHRFLMPTPEEILHGTTLRDVLAPDGIKFQMGQVLLGAHFRRVLYIGDFPASLSDVAMFDLLSQTVPMILSLHVNPLEMDKAMAWINSRIDAMEANQSTAQREKRPQPWDLKRNLRAAVQLREQLAGGTTRLFRLSAYIAITAPTLEALDEYTDQVQRLLRRHMLRHGVARFRQEQGFAATLPLAYDPLSISRTMTSQALSILAPFSVPNIWEPTGPVYGTNRVTGSLIAQDRRRLPNPAGFVFGQPGSGKSMAAKTEAHRVAITSDDDLIFIDAEGEYDDLVRDLEGQVVHIAPGAATRIGAMEVDNDYDPDCGDPYGAKAGYLLHLYDQMIGPLAPEDRSILDRVTRLTYAKHGPKATWVLQQQILREQPEERAQRLATALELYVEGSLNLFSGETNFNSHARILTYNLKNLNPALRPLAMQIILDSVWNRVCRNWRGRRRTWVYTDEMHLYFRNRAAAVNYTLMYKRCRKRGGILTGMTQNVEEVLRDEEARLMLANAEWFLLLKQAPTDLATLVDVLELPAAAADYCRDVSPGQGLMVVQRQAVPIQIKVTPHEYKLFNTSPSEGAADGRVG